MATTDMTRYKKFVDFQDISGETVPTNDGAFFYKDSAFETNSKINVAGDVSSSANVYASGNMAAQGNISSSGNIYAGGAIHAGGPIVTKTDFDQIFTQGNGAHIYTMQANSHIMTTGGGDVKTLNGGDISSSGDVYAAGSVVAGGHITTAGDIDQIYTQGNQSHIYTMQANSHIMTMGGGNISSSADVYAAQDLSVGLDLSVGRNVKVTGVLRTFGDVGHIYTKGPDADIYTWGGGHIYTRQGGKILTTGGGEISSSGDVYASGDMVAQGAITGSGIHSSGDFSSGGNISTIGGGNISSSGDVYVDGGIAAQNQIISRNQFLVMDQPGVAAAMMGQGVFANNGYHIKTFGGGDISSSANVYAAQTIGVGKVADSGYAIDVANGLGDIRASAFVTYSDRNLKQNINPINNALEKVMKLEAVSYEMKGNQKQEIGFIAQDVAKIIPEICAIGDDGEGKGIDYSRLTSMLVGAIKAQQQQIEELKAIIKK